MEYLKDLKKQSVNSINLCGEKITLISSLIERYSKLKKTYIKYEIPFEFVDQLNQFLNFRLFICYLQADNCCVLNAFLNAQTYYERKFAVRNFIVIVNEGIKKIYGFENSAKQNKSKTSLRNNSFWIKDVKPIIIKKFPSHTLLYEEITLSLDVFLEKDLENLKEYRDLSIHYDKDSLKVFTMLTQINFNDYDKVILEFLDIINKLANFCELICEKFIEDIDITYGLLEQKKDAQIIEILNLLYPKEC